MEYRERFEMLIAPLKHDERGMLESVFINGLRDEIQAELRLHDSRSLEELMDRALLIEDKNVASNKGKSIVKNSGDWGDKGEKWKSGAGSNSTDVGRSKTYITRPNSFITGPSVAGNTNDPKPNSGGGGERRPGQNRRLS